MSEQIRSQMTAREVSLRSLERNTHALQDALDYARLSKSKLHDASSVSDVLVKAQEVYQALLEQELENTREAAETQSFVLQQLWKELQEAK